MDVQVNFDFVSSGMHAAQYAIKNTLLPLKQTGEIFFPAKKRAPNVSKSRILEN